jgi:hypothetical protein
LPFDRSALRGVRSFLLFTTGVLIGQLTAPATLRSIVAAPKVPSSSLTELNEHLTLRYVLEARSGGCMAPPLPPPTRGEIPHLLCLLDREHHFAMAAARRLAEIDFDVLIFWCAHTLGKYNSTPIDVVRTCAEVDRWRLAGGLHGDSE